MDSLLKYEDASHLENKAQFYQNFQANIKINSQIILSSVTGIFKRMMENVAQIIVCQF